MKADILTRVRANAPDTRPHPGTASARSLAADAISRFTASAQLSYSKVVTLAGGESIVDVLRVIHPEARRLATCLPASVQLSLKLAGDSEWSNALTPDKATSIADLAAVQVAVLAANFVVVENGACWIPESAMGHRALPYSCEHLVVVVPKPTETSATVVETMHEAYARIPKTERSSFGCFIAGPSKTADIEQSLVIGAQGPRSLAIVFYET